MLSTREIVTDIVSNTCNNIIQDKSKVLVKVKWATGAGYCISASLMDKLEKYFRYVVKL